MRCGRTNDYPASHSAFSSRVPLDVRGQSFVLATKRERIFTLLRLRRGRHCIVPSLPSDDSLDDATRLLCLPCHIPTGGFKDADCASMAHHL
jgi:hypothetical protein